MHAPTKTWLEISAPALRANWRAAAEAVVPAAVIPVVKAQAYGHGLGEAVRALRGLPYPFLAVDSLEEADGVRAADPAAPVLILGFVPEAQLAAAVARGYSLVCSKRETVAALARLAAPDHPVRIHLEIETGLYRQGADAATLAGLLGDLGGLRDRVQVEGVCTHFANVEEPGPENAYPALQEARFQAACAAVERAGFRPAWRHIACSAAAWLRPVAPANAVRLGISLYGIWSSSAVRAEMAKRRPALALEPAIAWKTVVAEVKGVAAGETVGYGRSATVARPTCLAILPVGYADGFDRRLSSRGSVLIRGRRCPVLGRVCMNMCMVDVTDVPGIALEDEAVIFGAQGDERIAPEDWEAWVPGFIAYEAVARLSAGLPRRLVGAGEP